MMQANALPDLPKLPFDIECEQAVLGLCFRNDDSVSEVESVCGEDGFFDPVHRAIAAAMFSLAREAKPVSTLAVHATMEDGARQAMLKELHGYDYLLTLLNAAPSGADIGYSARILADLAARRKAIVALYDALEAAQNRSIPVLKALKPALEAADLAADMEGRRRFKPIKDAGYELLKEAEDALNGIKPPAVTTGLNALDDVLGGLQAGDFCVYAGRPGAGKTAMLLTTAVAAALAGRPVVMFSLEMPQKQLLQRVGCQIDYRTHPDTAMSYSWFRDGKAHADQIERMAEALQSLPGNFSIYDSGDMTIHDIAALARAFAQRHDGLGLVVIDYLQKIRSGDRYAGNKVQEVTEISGTAKSLALGLKWPVIVGAQLNRSVEGRAEPKPTLSDLRETGAIEQDADQVIGLYREGQYVGRKKPPTYDPGFAAWQAEYDACKNRLELLVLKNRQGETDNLSVWCDMRANAICNEKPRGEL